MPLSRKEKLGSLISLLALLVNLLPPFTPPAQATAASLTPAQTVHTRPEPLVDYAAPLSPARDTTAVLPGWFSPPAAPAEDLAAKAGLSLSKPAGVRSLPALPLPHPSAPLPPSPSASVLPGWFAAPNTGQESASAVLPGWFTPPAVPPAAPQGRPAARSIAGSLLQVNVTGPAVAAIGAPAGFGEMYTAVIRNNSSQTAYGVYLTATHQSYFVYDSFSQLLTRTGSIALNPVAAGPTSLTWTPVFTVNLRPGEAITLSFRLRAACNAVSAQQMRVGVRYNADPPPALPIELNTGGLNITTGRGNLVIKKEPVLQSLSTPDFGKPITWVVTVQNTGLGKLYLATITDTGGINLSQPTGDLTPSATIFMLDVNEVQTFTVVGTVEACNFTNVALASWPCGNQEGDATAANPVRSTASVLFTPEAPNVQVQVSPNLNFPYCAALTRTVTLTVTNPGGPAGNFRLDSTLESDTFLEVAPGSVSSGWNYVAATGLFSYTGGSPAGTLLNTAQTGPITLTFNVRPRAAYVCSAGSGSIAFTPLYQEVCSREPFTGNIVSLGYAAAQGQSPSLNATKSGPALVTSGEVFSYQVTISGNNPAEVISNAITITDTMPPEFQLIGGPTVAVVNGAAGVPVTATNGLSLTFDPAAGAFAVTLVYTARAITTTGDICGASTLAANSVVAQARPTCPGCPPLTATATVQTAIANEGGISANRTPNAALEACNPAGQVLANSYAITGSTVISWAGAVFTEALGINVGAGGLPSGASPLIFTPGSLRVTTVTSGGVVSDFSGSVTPVINAAGQLVLDLSPLQAAGAPTQTFTLYLTYTVTLTDGSLNGAPNVTIYDWAQLFLPGAAGQSCTADQSFYQATIFTLQRGDLQVSVAPRTLDRCRTNVGIIDVTGAGPGLETTHVVVTFTASIAEIESILAHNVFTYTGGLAALGAPAVAAATAIGGGVGIITFTFPTTDMDTDGQIQFLVDIPCTDTSVWRAGVSFRSRCGVTYGDTAGRDHLYRAPGLILSATPLQYTVREKQVLWKFFVTNNGNLTATNIVVTNAMNGLAVTGFTADAPGVTLGGSLPITAPAPAVFTIDSLAPNQMRAITVTADVFLCNPLGVTITTRLECFGQTCTQRQAVVSFDTPDPYLLTNNGQTADLPSCDLGYITFTVKNASADVHLYRLNITETLRGLKPEPGQPITVTILNAQGNAVATTTAFTPTSQLAGADRLLVWEAISAPTQVYTWFNSLPPLYVVRINVPVRTGCDPPDTPQAFAQASALAPCGKKLGYLENAVTLRTLKPDLTIVKQGRGPTGNFADTIYASAGETVTWRIRVENRATAQSYVAHNVVLSDTWPSNFNFIAAGARVVATSQGSSPAFTPTVMVAQNTITWDVGDVEIQDIFEFLITGTVTSQSDSCRSSTINRASLFFGCDDGCLNAIVPQDTANLVTRPSLGVALTPGPLQPCTGDIPIRVTNNGARAYNNVLTVTLPAGYVYSQTVSVGLTPTQIITTNLSAPVFHWDEIPSRTSSGAYQLDLLLRVKNSGSSGSCPVANGRPITVTMQYDDSAVCVDSGPYTTTARVNLQVRAPAFSVSKTPRSQSAALGQTITWTVRVTNTGQAVAENVIITDVVGSSFSGVTAGNGSDGAVPVVAGNAVAWTLPATMPVNGVWSATVRAVLNDTGSNRNVITATAGCATGCQTALGTSTAFATLLQDFAKNPPLQTGTIGSLAVFTFATLLPDVDALYSSLRLTDTLPTGLGYVSSALTVTADGDGNQGGPFVTTPAPALPGSNIVWALGNLSGTVRLDGVITAVIRNIPANQGVPPLRRVNTLRLSYVDDGQPYVVTDTAAVDIVEPRLAINKAVRSSTGRLLGLNGAALLTYTLRLTNSGTGPAYDTVITDAVPAGINVTALFGGDSRSGPVQGPGTLTWTVAVISHTLSGLNNPLVLTYTARISNGVQPAQNLTNVATTTWTSLPGDNPDERDGTGGPGAPPDDYADVATQTVTTGGTVTLTKRLVDVDTTRTLSGTVPYRLELALPIGAINNLVVTDTLEAGLIFNNDTVFSGPAGAPGQTVSTPNNGTLPVTVVWNFGAVTNPAANPQPLVITFTATVANAPLNRDGDRRDNDAVATWTDGAGPHTITDTNDADDVVTIEVPALVVNKTVGQAIAVPGDAVTWTVTVRNVGTGTAFGVDLSDALPDANFTYVPNSSFLNGSGPLADPVPSGLNLFWDLNQTLPGGAVFTLTFRTLVSLSTPQGNYTNVVTAVNSIDELNNPIPTDNGPRVPSDTDADDADDAIVLISLLGVSKTVADAVVIPNHVTTYTIRVSNPGGTALTLTVTDTLPAAFSYADNARVNGSPQEPDIITPPTLVWNSLPALNPGGALEITFRVTASTEVSGTYRNRVEVSGSDGINTITDTDTADTSLETHPAIVVTKTRTTPSPVAQGQPVVYNLTVQNTGDTTLHTVRLDDTFNPAHLQFTAANPAASSVTGGTIVWADLITVFGDFTPGMARTVALTFTARHVPGGVDTTNFVQATGIDTNTQTVTDIDSAPVTILSPRLTLDKRVQPAGIIRPGAVLTYSLCYSNSGTLAAANVVITDFVPFNTTFVPGSATVDTGSVEFFDGMAWASTEPLTVTGLRWRVGNLPPGSGPRCVQFNVRVNMTLSDTVSGLALLYTPQGWAVLAGDTSGLEIIGYTNPVTPVITATVTPAVTTTAVVAPTPEASPTPTAAATPPPMAAPTPTPVVTVTTAPPPAATPVLTITTAAEPEGTTQPAAPTVTPTGQVTATTAAVLPAWFGGGYVVQPAAFQAPVTGTVSATPTVAATATPAPSPVLTLTVTPAAPVTATVAATQPVPSATPTPTATAAPVLTVTPAITVTSAITVTPTATVTATPPVTETLVPTPAITATAVMSATGPEPVQGYAIVSFETVEVNVVNRATIGSNDTLTHTDTVTTPVIRVVDPRLTKSANPREARPGDLVRYTILVENPSPPANANATNVVMVDRLPPELTLVSYAVSAAPPMVVNTVVVSGVAALVNHPLDITQTVVYTLTMSAPELVPGGQITLSVLAQVNNVANPPPRTIRNTAILNFTEGSPRTDDSPVNVPLPPGDDDDDDDAPAPTTVPTPTLPAPVQPTPTLPILFLPETGLLEAARPANGGAGWWGVGAAAGCLALLWIGLKKRRKQN